MSIKLFNLLTLPRFHSEIHIRSTPIKYQTIKNVTMFCSSFLVFNYQSRFLTSTSSPTLYFILNTFYSISYFFLRVIVFKLLFQLFIIFILSQFVVLFLFKNLFFENILIYWFKNANVNQLFEIFVIMKFSP